MDRGQAHQREDDGDRDRPSALEHSEFISSRCEPVNDVGMEERHEGDEDAIWQIRTFGS